MTTRNILQDRQSFSLVSGDVGFFFKLVPNLKTERKVDGKLL